MSSLKQVNMHTSLVKAIIKTVANWNFGARPPGYDVLRFQVSVQAVEDSGVGVEDLVDDVAGQDTVLPQLAHRFDLRRLVVMAVVGADDQVILAHLLDDVRQIVCHLAGHVHVVALEDIGGAPIRIVAVLPIAQQVKS